MRPTRIPLNSRMTANPARPARYRAGKKLEESSEEEDEDDFEEEEEEQESQVQQKQPPPKATSFPKQFSVNRKDEGQKRLEKYEDDIRKRIEQEDRERMEREAGFVTESEESEDEAPPQVKPTAEAPAPPATAGSESEDEEASSEEDDSSEAESSSSDDQPKLLRPIFTKPAHRPTSSAQLESLQASSTADAETARRRNETDAHIQNQIAIRAAEKAARQKAWDDDDTGIMDEDAIDDTDGLDPELEHQQWVARELARLKRDRAALEEREAEIAEVERRRNLSTPEREAEDRETLDQQRQEKEGKGKMSFMQKYQHRGAFFQDDGEKNGLAKRDLMGARYVDQVENKDALPEYLRMRDQSKIGKKGGTRYKDMRSEDTGQFGGWVGGVRGRDGAGGAGGRDRTGANASALGEKRTGEGDMEGPRKKAVLARY